MADQDEKVRTPTAPGANEEVDVYDDTDPDLHANVGSGFAKALKGFVLPDDQDMTITYYGKDLPGDDWQTIDAQTVDAGTATPDVLIGFVANCNRVTLKAGATPPTNLAQSWRVSRDPL